MTDHISLYKDRMRKILGVESSNFSTVKAVRAAAQYVALHKFYDCLKTMARFHMSRAKGDIDQRRWELLGPQLYTLCSMQPYNITNIGHAADTRTEMFKRRLDDLKKSGRYPSCRTMDDLVQMCELQTWTPVKVKGLAKNENFLRKYNPMTGKKELQPPIKAQYDPYIPAAKFDYSGGSLCGFGDDKMASPMDTKDTDFPLDVILEAASSAAAPVAQVYDDELLQYLSTKTSPMTAREIAAATGQDSSYLNRLLYAYERQGKVTMVEKEDESAQYWMLADALRPRIPKDVCTIKKLYCSKLNEGDNLVELLALRNQEVSQAKEFKFKVIEHVAEELVRKGPGGVQVTEHPYCTDNVVIYYATTSDGKLCGAMSVIYNKPERYVHIDRLSTSQDPQTEQSLYKNVGSKLMQALYKDLEAGDEYDFIELDAYPSAIGFYQKLGFTLFDHSFININLDDFINDDSNLRWPKMYMDLRLATKLKVDFFRHLYHTILLASPKSLWLFLMEMQRVLGEDKLKLMLSNDTILRNLIIMIASVKGSIKHPEEMLMVLAYFLKLSDLQARRLANGDGLISHLGQNVCGNKRSVDDMDNETDDDEMVDDAGVAVASAVASPPVSSYEEPASPSSSAGVAAASVFGAAADQGGSNYQVNREVIEISDDDERPVKEELAEEDVSILASAPRAPPLPLRSTTRPQPLYLPMVPGTEVPYKQYNPYSDERVRKLTAEQRLARRPTTQADETVARRSQKPFMHFTDDEDVTESDVEVESDEETEVEVEGDEDTEDEESDVEEEETEADRTFVPEQGAPLTAAERRELDRFVKFQRESRIDPKTYVQKRVELPPSLLGDDDILSESDFRRIQRGLGSQPSVVPQAQEQPSEVPPRPVIRRKIQAVRPVDELEPL